MPILARALVDLVLPTQCVGCRRPGAPLCPSCCVPGPVLQVRAGPVVTFAAAPYRDALRRALIHYKERGRADLADPISRVLLRALAAASEHSPGIRGAPGSTRATPRLAIVPVPSQPSVRRRRGGDHLLRLVRLALRRGTPVGRATSPVLVTDALGFTRRVRDTAALDRSARLRNLAGAMRARRPPTPFAGVILVDDIVTTGATLAEAARALSAAGWSIESAAVVAATRPSGKGRDGVGGRA